MVSSSSYQSDPSYKSYTTYHTKFLSLNST